MDYVKGARVALHPACDEWMQGDRYGVVIGVGKRRTYRDRFTGELTEVRPVRVKLDVSGRIRRFHPEHLTIVEGCNGAR